MTTQLKYFVRPFLILFAFVVLFVGCPTQEKALTKEEPAADAKPDIEEAKADHEAVPVQRPPSLEAPEDVAAPPEDAQRTESGLASKVLSKGTGDVNPTATSMVTVHYTGWTTDGKMFDSSLPRGQPTTFPLNRVIPGWTEGLQLMVVGEKRRFWIPEQLAYAGHPTAPQGMLVFDVELLKIQN